MAYNSSVKLVEEVVLGLGVDSGAGQVAFVTYSDDAEVMFQLDEYSSTAEVLTAVSFYKAGGTLYHLLL